MVIFGFLYSDDYPPEKVRNPFRDSFGDDEKQRLDEESYRDADQSLRKGNTSNDHMNTSDIDSTFKQSPIVYDTFDRNSDYAKKHQRKSSHSRFEDNPSTKSLGGVSQDHSSRLSDAS